MLRSPSSAVLLAAALFVSTVVAACGGTATRPTGSGTFTTSSSSGHGGGSSSSSSGHGGAGPGAGGATGNGGGIHFATSSSSGGPCAVPGLDIQPSALQTITVTAGQTSPTVKFQALLDCVPVGAGWGLDKGNVGTIGAGPSSSATFVPTGTTGGLVTVTAGHLGKTVTRQVLVKLTATQNGPNTSPGEVAQIPGSTSDLTAGGGVGGVGGEGLGTPVTDTGTLGSFKSPMPAASVGLSFLYPYDKTVFPRGLLAPLLQWTWATNDADAIQIKLETTTQSFSYTGTFGRPAILAMTSGPFIRMPIPQDVWQMATNTAGGAADALTVSLVVSKGGVAYGPITETWTVAPTHLSGTIYYNSYGTQLVQNFNGAVGGNGKFGGAVLSIHVGDTAPKLAAGTATLQSGCRVCHSVASGGTRLVVQHGDSYGTSSNYDLSASGNTEHVMMHDATYPGMYPDGSMALAPDGTLLPLPDDTTPITTTGLTTVVTNLGQPAFSPDGKSIVFNPLAGPAPLSTSDTLYTMSFDPTTATFSGLNLVAKTPVGVLPGWPAFFPDSKSVVFHRQTVASTCDGASSIVTRSGARAQIYWTDLASANDVTPLDQLNGVGYLPKLAAASTVACNDACGTPSSPSIGTLNGDHSDDVDVNYEPTVAPTASGGYAWVVFTSRRMYGSVATIGSFCSDPRGVDLIQNITPKKLWVAAIDLTQKAGVDSSHPAFYLPAQELLAGNARGFWTLDPCAPNGSSCESGDECCNGFCEPNGDGGALTCSSTPPNSTCSGTGDKCMTSADCCDTKNVCVDGFCTLEMPN